MSTLRTDTLSNAAGSKSVPVNTVVDGSAKAWVNFNGTGTVAIRASFNVSSITDNGTGDYTVNFTSAMVDTNYAVKISGSKDSVQSWQSHPLIYSTSSIQVRTWANSAGESSAPALNDTTTVNVAVFR